MLTRWIVLAVSVLVLAGQGFAADGSDLQISVDRPDAVVTLERVVDEGKVLVSVSDAAGIPMLGLTGADFGVTGGGRTARITSALPVAESLDVPRHIVLVLDNSFSMLERNAVRSLLEGVEELLKIVRPIDSVQIVVFTGIEKEKVAMGGRKLSVQTFKSSHPAELNAFVADIYRHDTTSTTVLYEGILAGLDIIGGMPENEPKFMVVFSDGEDLNSNYRPKEVVKTAEGLGRFSAYAIDYMPGEKKDEFLTAFAEGNHGEIWKATSATNLVPIFQSVASRMQYYYVISYLFPVTGSLGVSPAGVTVDEVEAFAAAPAGEPPAGAAAARGSIVSRIDASTLTLHPQVDTAYGIARWEASLSNADGTLALQSGEGTLPDEIMLSLRTDDLGRLPAGGDIAVTVEVEDRKGQHLVLTAPPVTVNHTRTTGSLDIAPAVMAVDEIETTDAASAAGTSSISRIDTSTLVLRPLVDAVYGVARWKASAGNFDGALGVQAGEGAPPAEIEIPLGTYDAGRLAFGGDITVTMEVQDRRGQNLVLTAAPVKVNYFKSTGNLAVGPSLLTIEEVKTIDASPMLGHIYFAENSSEIPAKYVRLAGADEAAAFEEQRFRDTLEKYYQVLNILGKRLRDHPDATITLTGCNANTGAEKGNRRLSTARAEAVRAYLQDIWGIGAERMEVKARNLPEMPSTSRLEEGRADNRRVEISSEAPAIGALVRSTYLATRIDAEALILRPGVRAVHGIAGWKAVVANTGGTLWERAGQGEPPAEIRVPFKNADLTAMATGGDITVAMVVQDGKGQELAMNPAPVRVHFVQTSQRMAEKQGFRVQEKYALILFDFDSDVIDARNEGIVNSIVARIRELPEATVDIVGHTDSLGKEDYNIKLSERRALAVYKLLRAAYGEDPGERIRHRGVGPNDPLYDNATSETRAFNRTVTITLEYLAEDQ